MILTRKVGRGRRAHRRSTIIQTGVHNDQELSSAGSRRLGRRGAFWMSMRIFKDNVVFTLKELLLVVAG